MALGPPRAPRAQEMLPRECGEVQGCSRGSRRARRGGSTLGPNPNSSKGRAVPRPVAASAIRRQRSGYKRRVLISSGRNVVNFGLKNDLFLAISSPGRSGSVFQDLIFSKTK